MWQFLSEKLLQFVQQMAQLNPQIIVLVVLVVVTTIVIDLLLQRVAQANRQTGLSFKGNNSRPLSIEGAKFMPVRNYFSERQGLAGRPDAVIIEGGFFIPVEHKPLGKKMRDRYVAQLLVYMRLIEELEGKRPPYGYLIIGSNSRRIRVPNTRQRQHWLDLQLQEMRAILDGAAANPTPHPRKCAFCSVREFCDYRADDLEGQKS